MAKSRGPFAQVALGWVKFDGIVASAMTIVFLGFLAFMVAYMVRVTRPRFRFPKEHSRRPKAFYVDGYDPETGKVAGTRGNRPASRPRPAPVNNPDADADREAVAKALREINWLLQQGHLTAEEAAAQKRDVVNRHTGASS